MFQAEEPQVQRFWGGKCVRPWKELRGYGVAAAGARQKAAGSGHREHQGPTHHACQPSLIPAVLSLVWVGVRVKGEELA